MLALVHKITPVIWNVVMECGGGIGSLQGLGIGIEENRTGEGAGGAQPEEKEAQG